MLRKGVTNPDGSYTYTCGCGFRNPLCSYCYGNDLNRCREAIKTARGQVYYGLLKTILGHVGKQMADDVKAVRSREVFTIFDIGWVAAKYDLNFKATCEWLEEVGVIKTGIYDVIKQNGVAIKALIERGHDAIVCYERGRHEEYLIDGDKVCRQCGKHI